MIDFKYNILPEDLNYIFQYGRDVHNYNTRLVSNEGLFLPNVDTAKYGINSLKYLAPLTWNTFSKSNPKILEISISQSRIF